MDEAANAPAEHVVENEHRGDPRFDMMVMRIARHGIAAERPWPPSHHLPGCAGSEVSVPQRRISLSGDHADEPLVPVDAGNAEISGADRFSTSPVGASGMRQHLALMHEA